MKNPIKDDDSPIHILVLPTVAALGIAYIASWVDLLPDWFVGIGWLDDIAVAIGLMWFFTTWLPKNRHRIYWFKPRAQAGAGAGQSRATGSAESAQMGEFDPFEVLNVPRGASPDEVKAAYRNMLLKYHPDKVSHLGKDFQKIAHEKALDIQKAYEILCGKE